MANEKEVEQLETLIESMESASDALVKAYPGGSVAIKYMANDIKILVADLKGRDSLSESQKRQRVRSSEELPGITRPFSTEEMNAAQQKIFGVGH